MNTRETAEIFSNLSTGEKADFLAQLAIELTIIARGETYEVGTDNLENPQMMRTINEIQHRLLNHLSYIIKHMEKDYFYSNEDFWRMILELPDKRLKMIMENAVSRVSHNVSTVPA